MSPDVRRSADRLVVREEDRETRHSFSFGPHYDPANLGFGPMVCHFDDRLSPGGGYAEHPHTDLEIVTWVLDGVLVHTDSTGRRGTVGPGQVAVMSAGSGIRHSEIADPASGPTRFVQVWVRPDEAGTPPVQATHDLPNLSGGLVPVVSGQTGDAPRIGTRAATLWAGRLAPDQTLDLPEAGRQHVYVARGAVDLSGSMTGEPTALGEGDAVRLLADGGQLWARTSTDLLVWSFAD